MWFHICNWLWFFKELQNLIVFCVIFMLPFELSSEFIFFAFLILCLAVTVGGVIEGSWMQMHEFVCRFNCGFEEDPRSGDAKLLRFWISRVIRHILLENNVVCAPRQTTICFCLFFLRLLNIRNDRWIFCAVLIGPLLDRVELNFAWILRLLKRSWIFCAVLIGRLP